jgi:uncharacterized surface protein with fasciclin (FAS1) repeats
MTKRYILAVAPLLAALSLAACGQPEKAGADASPEPSSRTLAASVAANEDLDSLEALITAGGLETVLNGVGPYTIFAPGDAALTAAGVADLASAETRAQGVALLRAHIVPGALTRRDILAAVDRAGTRKVEMRTMDDRLLTFRRDGETLVVTAPGDASARLIGEETLASNGVIQPIDGVLARPAT